MSGVGTQTRVVPAGLRTSTRVWSSNVRQLSEGVVSARRPSGDGITRPAGTVAANRRKSRRFIDQCYPGAVSRAECEFAGRIGLGLSIRMLPRRRVIPRTPVHFQVCESSWLVHFHFHAPVRSIPLRILRRISKYILVAQFDPDAD